MGGAFPRSRRSRGGQADRPRLGRAGRPPGAGPLTASQVVARLGCGGGGEALVHGAGGVTGGLLVALAAAAGCRVVATCSPRAADRIRGYGASVVVDYHAAD